MRLFIRYLAMGAILVAAFTNPGASLYLECEDCDYLGCYQGDDCQDWDCNNDVIWGSEYSYCKDCESTMVQCSTPSCGEWEPPDYMYVECEFGIS